MARFFYLMRNNHYLFSFFFFLSLNIFAETTLALSQQQALQIVQDNQFSIPVRWQRLLYYDQGRSEVSNPDYFLHPEGSANPQLEIKETVRQMWDPTKPINDDHPLCKFPARFILLSQHLGEPKEASQEKLKNCQKLQEFMTRAQAHSVSLIFSSYYLHNPSSAFGHTLLKINRKGKSSSDLLGYGLNYAATVDTGNALVYGFKGIFGLFRGEFTAVPYYYKVREYSDYESRDLWSYELNFTPQEVNNLMLHIWELGLAWSDYLYLSKNCSYWILGVLETASEKVNLRTHLPSLYVLPIDTVRALYKNPQLVKDVQVRPSLRKKVLYAFKERSPSETRSLQSLVNKLYTAPHALPDLSQKPTADLEASMLLYDYVWAKEAVYDEKLFLKNKRPLLLERSRRKEKPFSDKDITKDSVPPHLFHPSSQVSLGMGVRDKKNFLSLGWKPALQDFIDPSMGFDSFSEINFFDLNLRLIETNPSQYKLDLGHFNLVRVGVVTPVTVFESKMAWRFRLGVQDLEWEACRSCNSTFASLATGLSWNFGNSRPILLFALFNTQLDFSHKIGPRNLRVGFGPQLGVRKTWGPQFKSLMVLNALGLNRLSSPWSVEWFVEQSHQYYFKDSDFALAVTARHQEKRNDFHLQGKFFF